MASNRALYCIIIAIAVSALFVNGCSIPGVTPVRKLDINRFFDDPQVRRLARAGASGDVATIKMLVSKGVDPNSVGKEGMTPLWWAFIALNNEGMKTLMEAGADPDYIPEGKRDTMLDKALTGSKALTVKLVETLLEGGADPNRRDKRGITPLNSALFGRPRMEKIQALVRHGANIHALDNCGRSLLNAALKVRAHDVAKWLIEQGIDVHHIDKNGGSAAWTIYKALTQHLYADWARKSAEEIKGMLEARGVRFPPISPSAWQEKQPPGWRPCL